MLLLASINVAILWCRSYYLFDGFHFPVNGRMHTIMSYNGTMKWVSQIDTSIGSPIGGRFNQSLSADVAYQLDSYEKAFWFNDCRGIRIGYWLVLLPLALLTIYTFLKKSNPHPCNRGLKLPATETS